MCLCVSLPVTPFRDDHAIIRWDLKTNEKTEVK